MKTKLYIKCHQDIIKKINSFKKIDRIIEEAKEKKLWIYAEKINIWLHPGEFEETMKKKPIGWRYCHLTLKDPRERKEELESEANEITKEIEKIESFLS